MTRDEFDAGGESATPVLDFLRDNTDRAYTLGELAQELSKTDVTLDDLDYAVRAMVESIVIEVKPRDDRLYYMYRSLR